MRKITKTLVGIMLIAVLSMTSITSFASEQNISPRLSHTGVANFTFSATANGGYADVTYYGYDSFVRADLTVKVEKSFLLFFWSEIGTWSSSSTEMNGDFFHTFTLDGSGKYRASFTLTVTGNDGTVDTITDVIESRY